ncbi:MAG: ATP-binding cassette domain-containing protein [Anaerolineales bacterium]|nr:ATP-binding cassette domain-containing protein [Anaerolineales bacterium]
MSIVLEHLTKRYDGHPVVNNVSLEIKDGEFFVLLGSSGSGKTTILNLIAGLTGLDQGRILLHGRDVTHIPTQQRKVGFVFQNYALFQHMTVAENIEFGLTIHKVPKAKRQARKDELLDLVGLSGLGERMPRQLSGGQQQRVALARALAFEPDVLLLDEPLGALDAKIRHGLRRSLKGVQRKLGIASILVTHDQEEAFDLADRIGVMSFGRLLEVGTPEDLYQNPQSEFVASFLGVANLLVGKRTNGKVNIGDLEFQASTETSPQERSQRVQVLFRPEDAALAASKDELDHNVLGLATVEEVGYGGSVETLRLRLPPIPGVRSISPPVPYGSETILIDATRNPDEASRFPLHPGDQAWVGVRRIHTLAHPGLSFLIPTDGSMRTQGAISLGGQIAQQAHARVTLVGYGKDEGSLEAPLQEARKRLGGGLAAVQTLKLTDSLLPAVRKTLERQAHDVIVLSYDPNQDNFVSERILESGDHHLLLVPAPQVVPNQILAPVAAGEPGKEDILLAGRLSRHLGAEITLMTVIPDHQDQPDYRSRIERYLKRGVTTLETLEVPAKYMILTGSVEDTISKELRDGNFDLLILGAPLADRRGQISFSGLIGQILKTNTTCATLIVRSNYIGSRLSLLDEVEIAHSLQEVR